jgi:hypothetical protein
MHEPVPPPARDVQHMHCRHALLVFFQMLHPFDSMARLQTYKSDNWQQYGFWAAAWMYKLTKEGKYKAVRCSMLLCIAAVPHCGCRASSRWSAVAAEARCRTIVPASAMPSMHVSAAWPREHGNNADSSINASTSCSCHLCMALVYEASWRTCMHADLLLKRTSDRRHCTCRMLKSTRNRPRVRSTGLTTAGRMSTWVHARSCTLRLARHGARSPHACSPCMYIDTGNTLRLCCLTIQQSAGILKVVSTRIHTQVSRIIVKIDRRNWHRQCYLRS